MTGHIRERGPGKWALVYDAPPGPDGRRRQKTKIVHGTKKEAQKALREIHQQIDNGCYVEPDRISLADYLDRWLKEYVQPNLSAKTAQEYAQKIRSYVVPNLGATRLVDLKPLHLQSFYNRMLESGGAKGTGLSARSVLHIHRVLHKALGQAVKWQMLLRNPTDAAEAPKCRQLEMRVLDPAAVPRLLEATADTSFHMPVLLSLSTGMRRGEVLALRWADVDLDTGVASICRSAEQTKAGVHMKETKTAKSRRAVTLPASVIVALREHRGRQAQNKLLLGDGYQDHDLVCSYPDGRPIDPRYISSSFPSLLRRAGLPHIRFHDLRHTHATLLLAQGVHPKIVSERLGHSTIGITLDTYSHVLPTMQEEAARKIDSVLKAASTDSR